MAVLAAIACSTIPTTRNLICPSSIYLPSSARASHCTTRAVDPTSQCTSQSTSKRVLFFIFPNLIHRNLSLLSRSAHFQLHSLLLREIVFLSASFVSSLCITQTFYYATAMLLSPLSPFFLLLHAATSLLPSSLPLRILSVLLSLFGTLTMLLRHSTYLWLSQCIIDHPFLSILYHSSLFLLHHSVIAFSGSFSPSSTPIKSSKRSQSAACRACTAGRAVSASS